MRIYSQKNSESQRAIGHPAVSSLLLIVVFLCHCLAGVLLYQGRAAGWQICDSDLIVFGTPFIFAVAGYAYLLFTTRWLRPASAMQRLVLSAICLILVFLSTWCYIFLALNRYGS